MQYDEFHQGTRIEPVDLVDKMRSAYVQYSMSVIVSRALPDVRDGLKPVHRRILYTMFENNLTAREPYHKCADTVGSVLGRYHPHGDASVYDALVRMAQTFSLRYPLVDGQGNFGSVDGDPPAAYRYTEARMSKIAADMLTDIEKDTVDFAPNYDDRLREPTVLPSRFPNLLVNGSDGIAVGMATKIPPHNLGETIDAALCLIDDPDATLEELMEHIKGPDFPTAGIIMGRAGIRAAYATGRGKIVIRARAEIEEHRGRNRIVVTELPYQVNKAKLLMHIADLVKEKRLEGISDLRDESDKTGIRMVIELKRDANPQIVLNNLYRFTQMQDSFGVILLALHNGEPKMMTLKDMLRHYIDFQCEVTERRVRFDLKKAQERAHILEGLRIALDYIDEVISILRSSKTVAEGKERLIERFGLTDPQATAIVQMTLGRLTGMERQKIEDELAGLLMKIGEYEALLADHQKLLGLVREELSAVRDKYADERRTEIQAVSGEVDIEDLIPMEDCIVTMTHYGYIKRQAADEYRSQKRGGRGVSGMKQREEDFVEQLFVASTHDYVMFLTDRGRVFRLKCYEIAEGSRTARGTNIVNLLSLEPEEKVTTMLRIKDAAEEVYLTFVTKNGIIKRTELPAYRNVRKSGLIAISLDEGDRLIWVGLTGGRDELLVATRQGMAIRFSERDARTLSRTARGVRAIHLREGDEVVDAACLREGATVVTITEQGKGRRTRPEEYRLQARGGFGVTNYRVTEQTGAVAGVKVVDEDDDLMMIADDGIIIRIHADEIGIMSRYASGVRVMRVQPDSKLVTFVPTDREKEDVPPDEEEIVTPAETE